MAHTISKESGSMNYRKSPNGSGMGQASQVINIKFTI